MNPSKKGPKRRPPPRVQFEWTLIVIGTFAGILTGLVLSMVLKPNLVRAQLCGAAGLILGSVVEWLRFWWRSRKRREQVAP